ncbi:MAG: hypothetical protein ABL927_01730 [Bdellovibrionales bacterium]
MTNQPWMPINEYAAKYKISQSTLRRRIRAGAIEFKFDDGKYWLPDIQIKKHVRVEDRIVENLILKATEQDDQKIISELKSVYVSALHEKEEQIMYLKEEINDLKTLVKVLESENSRLASHTKESESIDSWIVELDR